MNGMYISRDESPDLLWTNAPARFKLHGMFPVVYLLKKTDEW